MRTAFFVLLVSAIAGAQESAAVRDPAALFPKGTPIYVEVDGLSGAARVLGRSPLGSLVDPKVREQIAAVLSEIEEARVARTAIGVIPGLIFATRWMVLAETPDPAGLVAKVSKRVDDPRLRIASGELGPFVALANAPETLATARGLAAKMEPALSEREDFAAFRARTAGGVIRFHLDLRKLAPIRPGLNKNDDVGAVFLAHHLLHVAKTAKTLSGALAFDGGASIVLTADVDPIPEARAFTESRPAHAVLAPPEGCAARLSLTRDVAAFWMERESLLRDSARAPFAEFQNNLGILMGGLSVEDVASGLGSAFDLYVCRGDPAHPAGRRYPAAAVVAAVRDREIEAELPLSFQTTIGIVNAQRAMEGQPRFFQESASHRDVPIAAARILPESVPDPSDERLQLEPSLAMVKGRMILGSNRAITRMLVDQALDGREAPRAHGDQAELFGSQAAAAFQDASAIVLARMLLGKAQTPDEARAVLDRILGVLGKVDRSLLTFDVEGTTATMELRLQAPGIFPAEAAESR